MAFKNSIIKDYFKFLTSFKSNKNVASYNVNGLHLHSYTWSKGPLCNFIYRMDGELTISQFEFAQKAMLEKAESFLVITNKDGSSQKWLAQKGAHPYSESKFLLLDLSKFEATVPNRDFKPIGVPEIEEFYQLYSTTYQLDEDTTRAYGKGFYLNSSLDTHNHLIMLDGQAVGFGLLTELSTNQNVALFSGAGILKKYRGHKLYQDLLNFRIKLAKDLGKKFVLIESTDARITAFLRNFGFKNLEEGTVNYLYSYKQAVK